MPGCTAGEGRGALRLPLLAASKIDEPHQPDEVKVQRRDPGGFQVQVGPVICDDFGCICDLYWMICLLAGDVGRKAAIGSELTLNIGHIACDKHDPTATIMGDRYSENQRRMAEGFLQNQVNPIGNEWPLGIKGKDHDTPILEPGLCLDDAFPGIYIMVKPGIGESCGRM